MITKEEIRLKCLEIASRNHGAFCELDKLIAEARVIENFVSENTQDRALLILAKLEASDVFRGTWMHKENDDDLLSVSPLVKEWLASFHAGLLQNTPKVD